MLGNEEFRVRVPSTLTLRDLVYMGIVIVSITTSFLLYGTRLSITEQKLLDISSYNIEHKRDFKEEIQENKETHTKIEKTTDTLQQNIHDLETNQATLRWWIDDLKRDNEIE